MGANWPYLSCRIAWPTPPPSLDVPPLVSYGSAMAIHAGRHQFGPDNGRITLRTSRDGLAAGAGHDLTIDAVRWSGELVLDDDRAPVSLTATVDLGALVVRAGSGGLKPLTDRDKREIAVTSRKVLSADRYPEATFTATSFEPSPDGTSGVITGTLTLAGQSRPQQLPESGCPASTRPPRRCVSGTTGSGPLGPWGAQGGGRCRGGGRADLSGAADQGPSVTRPQEAYYRVTPQGAYARVQTLWYRRTGHQHFDRREQRYAISAGCRRGRGVLSDGRRFHGAASWAGWGPAERAPTLSTGPSSSCTPSSSASGRCPRSRLLPMWRR
jgi:polyisoprenoid-binding protein YceI